jgi:TPR repeat protein
MTCYKKAQRGNVKAMEAVAMNYESGKDGFDKDKKKAYSWFEKAHHGGSVLGTASIGDMQCKGLGVAKKNEKEGLKHTALAAASGSDYASYNLGIAYADGLYGLPQDANRAIYLLQQCLSRQCPHLHMTQEANVEAELRLKRLRRKAGAYYS